MAITAVLSALKVVGILSLVLAAVVGIDLLQILFKTKFDQLFAWWEGFQKSVGDRWDQMKSDFESFFKNYVKQPFDTMIYWFGQLDLSITELEAQLLKQIADVLRFLTADETANKLDKFADRRLIQAQQKSQQRYDQYVKDYSEEKAKQYLGERDSVNEYKLSEEQDKSIEVQAEIDSKDNPNQVVVLDNGLKVSLNSATESLEDLALQLRSENKTKDAEVVEKITETHEIKENYIQEAVDDVEYNGLTKFWKENISKDLEGLKQNELDVQAAKVKATKEIDGMIKEGKIKPVEADKLNHQINEKQMRDMEYYDPYMANYRAHKESLAMQKQSNNVQVNNQNNNTNNIIQPLNVNNSYHNKQDRTNIGTK